MIFFFFFFLVYGQIQVLSTWNLSPSTKNEQYSVTVPSTVIAGLLQNNVYGPNIFFNDNLKRIDESNFSSPWIYSTEFESEQDPKDYRVILHFEGMSYKASVWVNGKLAVSPSQFIGTFRIFEFDISSYIRSKGSKNSLVIHVQRPYDFVFPPGNNSTDLAISFIDWNPPPVDGSMGLFRPVKILYTRNVLLDAPSVVSTVDPDLGWASLSIRVDLINWKSESISGIVHLKIEEPFIKIEKEVHLSAHQRSFVRFDSKSFPILNLTRPQFWWPWQMGDPKLHDIEFEFIAKGSSKSSSSLKSRFGIRQMTSILTSNQFRLYQVNHKPILIRGGGYTPDMFLREYDEKTIRTHFEYVKDMGLNTIRLEGKMETDLFFDLADEYGVLVMPGWACCDAWQHWSNWKDEQYLIARESLISQVRRYRIHPSILVFLYSSDDMPPPDVEKMYLQVFKDEEWPNPILSSASDLNSSLTGPTGVKMSGPYSWVPPIYWSEGAATQQLGFSFSIFFSKKKSGAFSFLTEGGPGEAPMTFESFSRTVSPQYFWPINSMWDAHCGNPKGVFHNLRFFIPPLNARYGPSSSVQEFLFKSQVAEYEAMRAMFEAYSQNKYTSTGLIQWMLNNAYPEMIWHTYDYYFNQGGSYFGTKKGCEMLHIQFNYYDRSIWILNSGYQASSSLTARAEIYDIRSQLRYARSKTITSIDADSTLQLFVLPSFSNLSLSQTFFLRLTLSDFKNNTQSKNDYALSLQNDVLVWDQSNFYRTPCSQYANLTLLQTLPSITPHYSMSISPHSKTQSIAEISLSNPSSTSLIFFVHLRIVDVHGNDLTPIFWSDNYITLLPLEKQQLTCIFPSQSGNVSLLIESFNSVVSK